MSVYTDPAAFLRLLYGVSVSRATAGTGLAGATASLFTVTGGRVLLTGIVGEVTTQIGATPTNAKLISTPTTGTAVDLCAALAVAGKEVGTLLGITGIFADALVGANAGATVMPQRAVVVPIGNIGLNTSANAGGGSIKWTLTYAPLDTGAVVAAA